MKAQISAGLNFAMSGIPYWTMDIGGFCVESRYTDALRQWEKDGTENADLREWCELNVRWHRFGAFCPLYRSPFREIWNIAPPAIPPTGQSSTTPGCATASCPTSTPWPAWPGSKATPSCAPW